MATGPEPSAWLCRLRFAGRVLECSLILEISSVSRLLAGRALSPQDHPWPVGNSLYLRVARMTKKFLFLLVVVLFATQLLLSASKTLFYQ